VPQLIWKEAEAGLAESSGPLNEFEHNEELLRVGDNDWSGAVQVTLSGLHTANILSVQLIPHEEAVLTSSGR
jgi:hypothetical protein